MEWISVDDRLPKDERKVAIVYEYKDSGVTRVWVGEYSPFEERWKKTLDDIKVTHWMPLPEIPE